MRRTRQSSGGLEVVCLRTGLWIATAMCNLRCAPRDDGERGKRANGSARRTGVKGRCAVNGRVLSTYTVTAREAHLCGERGSPAVGKGIVCLRVGYTPQGGGKHALGVFGG